MPGFGGMGRNFSRMGVMGGANYNPAIALGSDLLAWWDADSRYWGANGNITVATGVSSWKDIVAGLDLTQATGSAQPTFSATSFNGAPGVASDGSDDALALTLAGQFPATASPSELWALVQQDSLVADTGAKIVGGYGNGANGDRSIRRAVTTGVNRGRGATGDGVASQARTGTVVDMSTRHIVRWEVGATTSTLTIDGIAEGSVSVVPNTTATRFRMFALSGTASLFWQGQCAAFMIVNPLSAAKSAPLQSWFMGRRRP